MKRFSESSTLSVMMWVLLFIGTLILGGCGGRAVDNELSSDKEKMPSPSKLDEEEHDSSDRGSNLQRLGECQGGHDVAEANCPWMDPESELCFPSKEDACACLCPQDRDSVCVSGFFRGENGQTPVYCN